MLSGTNNPLHTDVEYATPRFGDIIAHGTLVIGLFSATMYQLLGPGAVARTFSCKLRAVMRPGDDVRIELAISDLVARIRKVVVEGKAYVGPTLVITTRLRHSARLDRSVPRCPRSHCPVL